GLSDPNAQRLRLGAGMDRGPEERGVCAGLKARAAGIRHRYARREGGNRDRRLHRGRHVRQLLHRLKGRQERDGGCRAAIEADLSLTNGSGRWRRRPLSPTGTGLSPMADIALAPRRAKTQIREATAWDQLKHNRNWLGFWFMLPAMAFLVLFLAYPLGLGVWISFTDARIGRPGAYVGLENYEWLWDDAIFWLSVFNTLVYTFIASAIKFAIGLYLALLLNENMPFKAMLRALVLIPFIVPTVLSALAFWWIFDSQFSIISWSLKHMGLIDHNINFLGDQ